jgi:hypothetical protein
MKAILGDDRYISKDLEMKLTSFFLITMHLLLKQTQANKGRYSMHYHSDQLLTTGN